ncbi:MAG TPA: hypothetical protein VN612_04605 [Acidobacteriaceae bacterium]|nr:hypothetical protein [Acidobacteriaceae bacterium]
MGDRTYCQIEIAKRDDSALRATLVDEHGFEEEGDSADRLYFGDAEANYGGSSAVADLQDLRLPFFGYHDAGGDYSPMVFAFDGATYAECAAIVSAPVCTVDDNGEPNQSDLKTAREYLKVHKRAKQRMTAEPLADCSECLERIYEWQPHEDDKHKDCAAAATVA